MINTLYILEADMMMDLSTQSKSRLGDDGCGCVQIGVRQGREGLGSGVTGWDEDHTQMTIQVT